MFVDLSLRLVEVPFGQFLQGIKPVADHWPGEQKVTHNNLDVEPSALVWPVGHFVQASGLTEPTLGLYVPVEHLLH